MSDTPAVDIDKQRKNTGYAPSPSAALPSQVQEDLSAEGLKTSTPSNYQNSLGNEPKSLISFEVKREPGRL